MFVGFLWFIADCYEKKMAMAVPLSSFFAHSLVRLLEPLLSFIIMCIAHHIFRTCICSKDAFLSDMSIVKIWNRCFRVGTLALLRCSVQRQVARGVICVGIDLLENRRAIRDKFLVFICEGEHSGKSETEDHSGGLN